MLEQAQLYSAIATIAGSIVTVIYLLVKALQAFRNRIRVLVQDMFEVEPTSYKENIRVRGIAFDAII
jgi:hypothetical protein